MPNDAAAATVALAIVSNVPQNRPNARPLTTVTNECRQGRGQRLKQHQQGRRHRGPQPERQDVFPERGDLAVGADVGGLAHLASRGG